jgi:anti-anti-sigma factor
MEISQSVSNDATTLKVSGDVDVANADQFRSAAIEACAACGETLRIDLGSVTFMDSTGLGALVFVRNHAASVGVAIVLQNVPARVVRIMEITGLTAAFTIEPA